jgi:ABC-2 type transport system ATP-binding protein
VSLPEQHRGTAVSVIETDGLSKRYGDRWALRDCSLTVPAGRVVGLVGPNGAGKTTLLQLVVGLLRPTSGTVSVLGDGPPEGRMQLARIGFVAQETPLYGGLSVAEHLVLGGWLNPAWDGLVASHRIEELGLDKRQKAGRLSGGQRAQLALTLAIGKRPEVLILDEPVASLDPLARRDFIEYLSEAVAEQQMSVVLSSHLVSDLAQVCDYLVVLAGSRVQVTGEVDSLLKSHYVLTGARREPPPALPPDNEVIDANYTDRLSTFFVRGDRPVIDQSWTVDEISLDSLVLAYMSRARTTERAPRQSEVTK